MQRENHEAARSNILEPGSLRKKVPQRGGWGFAQGFNSSSNRSPMVLPEKVGLKSIGPECRSLTAQTVAARHDGSQHSNLYEPAAADWIPV